MSYQKLTEQRKKSIAKNAKEYAEKNYIQKNLKLKPSVVAELDEICAENGGISYAAMLEKLIKFYKNCDELHKKS